LSKIFHWDSIDSGFFRPARYFAFFTILSNLFGAVLFLFLALALATGRSATVLVIISMVDGARGLLTSAGKYIWSIKTPEIVRSSLSACLFQVVALTHQKA
jgi:hypothetical protein